MSLRKRLKSIGQKVQNVAKDVGREVQTVAAKVVVPVSTALSVAGSFVGGPVLGGAFAAGGTAVARVTGATAARAKGEKGIEARSAGRELAGRTGKYAMIGVGAGTGAAGLAGVLGLVQGGGGILGGLTGGVGNMFGIGGGPDIVEAGSTIFDQGEAQYMPPGAGTGSYSGDYYSGTQKWGGWDALSNIGGAAATALLGKPQATGPQVPGGGAGGEGGAGGAGGGGLMDTLSAPGVTGSIPMWLEIAAAVAAVWAVSKN